MLVMVMEPYVRAGGGGGVVVTTVGARAAADQAFCARPRTVAGNHPSFNFYNLRNRNKQAQLANYVELFKKII